jgi:ligand-binding sensor domain-containing protein
MNRCPSARLAALAAGLLFCVVARVALGQSSALFLPATSLQTHSPASVVYALAQTTDRYVWFGTQVGLIRYDGARFASFVSDTSVGVPAGSVTALYATRANALWVATTTDVAVYENGVFRPAAGLKHSLQGVRRIVQDAQGWLWLATKQGLFQTHEGAWFQHTVAEGLPSTDVTDVALDPQGGLWVQTSLGRAKRVADRFEAVSTMPDVATALLPLPLLGIQRVQDNPAAWSSFFGANIGAALVDTQDNLWTARPFGGGLLKWNTNRRDVFTMRNGLGANAVTSLLQEGDGGVWVGAIAGGATYLHEQRLRTLRMSDGLPGNVAYAVAAAPQGGVWVTSSGGVAKVDSTRVQVWPPGKSLPLAAPRWLTVDSKGAVWVADPDGKLAVMVESQVENASFVLATADRSPTAPSALYADRQGYVWLASLNGALEKVSTTTAQTVRQPDPGCVFATSEPCAGAFSVFADRSAGGVWAGSFGQGVWQITDNGAQQVLAAGLWRHAPVSSLVEDDAGVLWIGTNLGLVRYDGKQARLFTAAHGLPVSTVFSLIQDGAGNLWGAGPAGVFKMQIPVNFLAQPTFVSFGVGDGLASEFLSSRFASGAARSTDGRLWFSGDSGLSVFEAPEHFRAPATPSVFVESVTDAKGTPRSVLFEDEEIPVARNNVRIAFSAPAFFEAQRLRFRYRVGRDPQEWVNVGTERFAHLVSLPPGTSQFEVAVSRLDTPASWQSARIVLFVSPKYYERPIFIVLLVISASAFSWALHENWKRRAQLRLKDRSDPHERPSQHQDSNS